MTQTLTFSRRGRTLTENSPVTVVELCAMIGIATSTFYKEHLPAGYKIRYPRLRKTTAAHFLEWCERDCSESDRQRLEAEIDRHRS